MWIWTWWMLHCAFAPSPWSCWRGETSSTLCRCAGPPTLWCAKIAVRNLRRDANEAIKKLVKDKLASEDDQKRCEADIQKVTDKHVVAIDQLVVAKEHDIMAV